MKSPLVEANLQIEYDMSFSRSIQPNLDTISLCTLTYSYAYSVLMTYVRACAVQSSKVSLKHEEANAFAQNRPTSLALPMKRTRDNMPFVLFWYMKINAWETHTLRMCMNIFNASLIF